MNIRHPNGRALGLLVISAFAVALIGGCKSPESQIVGTWTAQGTSVVFKADKTFSQTAQAMTATGKWSLNAKKVNMVVETIQGKPAEDALQQLAKMGVAADKIAKAKESLKKGTDLLLSDDGKTMKPAEAPAGMDITLTKQESK